MRQARAIRLAPFAITLILISSAPRTAVALEVRSQDQRLISNWYAQDERFGSVVAMDPGASASALALVGAVNAPDGGNLAVFSLDGSSWAWDFEQTSDGPQTVAADVESGVGVVAFRELDGTSTVWTVMAAPSVELVESNIPGAISALAAHWNLFEGVVVVGQADFAGGAGRILIYEGIFGGSFELVGSDAGGAGDRLGASLAMSDWAIVAGMPGEGANGAAKVYLRASEWVEWQQLDSPAISQTDAEFGAAVDISEDGRWIAVGSPDVDRVTSPGEAWDVGAVYLYESGFLTWDYATLLRPAGAGDFDHFGAGVALHGPALVAGSPGWDGSEPNQGAAHVFHLSGPAWREHLRLLDDDPDEDDALGASVAMGAHGALVGAPRRDVYGQIDAGAANYFAGVVGLFFDGFESGDLSSWSDSAP